MTQKVPIRDSDDKWHVTFGEYPDETYPDYMGGPGYVLSHLAAKKVVEYSYHIPFMPMEDVFVGESNSSIANVQKAMFMFSYISSPTLTALDIAETNRKLVKPLFKFSTPHSR